MRNAQRTCHWLWLTLTLAHSLVTASEPQRPPGPLPIPDRLVVLSFDDGNKSDITYVAPALQRIAKLEARRVKREERVDKAFHVLAL